jgi:hypothetical protein
MNTESTVKIKEWKLLLPKEKSSLTYMNKLAKLYVKHIEGYALDVNYIKILEHIEVLKVKQAKEQERLELLKVKQAKDEERLQQAKEKEQARLAKVQDRIAKEQEKDAERIAKEEIQRIREIETEAEEQERRNAINDQVATSKLTLQEIINKHNYHQIKKGNKLMWYFQRDEVDEFGNRIWDSIGKEVVKAKHFQLSLFIPGRKGESNYSALDEFSKLLMDQGRSFNNVIQSYRAPAGVHNGELNIMNKEFAKPSVDGSKDYHWFFDVIFTSLSGGTCKDTKEHLEKLLLAKWQHPENTFLPGIFINDKGATLKDLFANVFLRHLFGGNVLYNGSIEHLLGKFNAVIAGKAIVHVSEVKRDKVNVDKLKSILNAPKLMVEQKFEIPYEADNTMMLFSVGNGSQGSVTLSGENQDRRYSIFSPPGDGYDLLIAAMQGLEGIKMTREEADNWIVSAGQYILMDPIQMGKWLSAKIADYGDIKHLRPIRNEAYHKLIDKQRASWTSIVETVFEDPNFEYIRTELLRELVMQYNKGGFTPARETMTEEIERLIRDRGYSVVKQRNSTIKTGISATYQRTTWRKNAMFNENSTEFPGNRAATLGQLVEDESSYGVFDSTGRWIWTWKA